MCVCVQPTKRVRCGDGTSAAAAARQSADRDDDQSRRVSDQLISFFSLGSDAAGGVVGLITFSVGGLMPTSTTPTIFIADRDDRSMA